MSTPNASENVEQQEFSFTAGGNAKHYSLAVFLQTKHTLTVQSNNYTPSYLPK